MSQVYDFTLGAAVGASSLMLAAGTRFKLLSSNGVAVKVRTDNGRSYVLREGQGFRATAGFREVLLQNTAALLVVGQAYIGEEDFIDDRVTGTVDVVDGERNKVLSGVCFRGTAGISGAAGFPTLQLWNGSTARNMFVTACTVGSSAADGWTLQTTTNQLPGALGNPCNSHDSAGGTAQAVMRSDNTGAALTGARVYGIGYVQAAQDRIIVLPRPILVRPSTGLVISLGSVGSTLRVTFEFEEWPV